VDEVVLVVEKVVLAVVQLVEVLLATLQVGFGYDLRAILKDRVASLDVTGGNQSFGTIVFGDNADASGQGASEDSDAFSREKTVLDFILA